MTKKEQLKVAFEAILRNMLESFRAEYYEHVEGYKIGEYANLLLKEVSIRTPLK